VIGALARLFRGAPSPREQPGAHGTGSGCGSDSGSGTREAQRIDAARQRLKAKIPPPED
jgi:hypothetical protein